MWRTKLNRETSKLPVKVSNPFPEAGCEAGSPHTAHDRVFVAVLKPYVNSVPSQTAD
jgi:hypothetical protein